MRLVRSGVEIYRYAILLNLLVQLLTVALLISDPSVGRLTSLSSGGVSVSSTGTAASGSGQGYLLLLSLFGLIAFVVSLVAFVRWRRGVLALRRDAVPFGPFDPIALRGPAQRAEAGYRKALWTMLLAIVAALAGGVAVAAIAFSSLPVTQNSNGTVSAPTPDQVIQAVSAALPAIIVLAAVVFLIDLLLVYFVTESLHGFVELGGTGVGSVDLGTTRWIVFLAVLFGVGGLLNFVVEGAGAIAIVSPLLLFVACQRYLKAFDDRFVNSAF